METSPIIGVTAWNSYPGSRPGQRGGVSTTVIQFLDLEGRITALVQALAAKHEKVSAVTIEAATSTGFRHKFLQMQEGWLKDQEANLQLKVHLMVRKVLRRTPVTRLRLEVSTNAGPYEPVEHDHQKHHLMELMESARHLYFHVRA